MKVLVIGVNGFLGRNLIPELLKRGDSITGVYNRRVNWLDERIQNIQVSEINTLPVDYDIVYFLSAFIPYGKMDLPDPELINVNVNLVNKVSKKFPDSKLVFASSVSVYGNHSDVVDELSCFNSPNLYGQSKIAGELVVKCHPRFAIIRFSSIYGIGMTEGTFLTNAVKQAREGKIILFGDGYRMQNYIHVKDAALFLIKAGDSLQNGIFLGVHEKSYSNKHIAEIIASEFDHVSIVYEGRDDTPDSLYDPSATVNILNFKCSVSIEEGLFNLIHGE